MDKNKKTMIVFLILNGVVLLGVVGMFYSKKSLSDIYDDGLENNVTISAEQCEKFFNRHKTSLDFLVEEMKKQSPDYTYRIVFDNEGRLKLDNNLDIDKKFIEVLNEIYSDEIFKLNHYFRISVRPEENNQWRIEFRLFTNKVRYGGMIYHDEPMEDYWDSLEKKFDDNWYWYAYPTC